MPPGRKPHKPTERDRKTAEAMTAYGIPQDIVAKVLGIDKKTLIKYYREELDTAKAKAIASVAEMLYAQCKQGNVTAMIFYLKTQAKWSERIQHESIGDQVVRLNWSKPIADSEEDEADAG
jgi:hypothetical protein